MGIENRGQNGKGSEEGVREKREEIRAGPDIKEAMQ
jgi:hypothetical protein